MQSVMPPVAEQLKIIRENTVEILPEGELEKKLEKSLRNNEPLIIKQGFDPTAPDIHLGHTVGLRKLKQFCDLGHKVVVIIGDYTAQVGDPSGRSATRPQLTKEQVEENAKTYLDQFFKVLPHGKVEVRYNGEWFADMPFSDILRLCGKMTLARMMEREDFTKRWKEAAPISIHELLYPLMQAYDSVAIKSDIELGATEQKFNLLTGRQIQEAYGVEPQIALTLPVLEGTDGIQRMSKSIGNYVGISEPSREIFGKLMSIPDRLIVPYFRLVSDLESGEIDEVEKRIASGANPMEFKKKLGRTIVRMYYDVPAAEEAQREFEQVFTKGGLPDEIPEIMFDWKEETVWLPKLMAEIGATGGTGEAIRLIKQGGVSIDGEKVSDHNAKIPVAGKYLLKVGKRGFYKVKGKVVR